MKYFLEFYQSWRWDETDEEAERSLATLQKTCDDYKEHIKTLEPNLSSEVLAIADAFYVHDAVVSQLTIDRGRDQIKFVLRCGNIPEGYFDLELLYESATISSEHEGVLKEIAKNTTSGRQPGHECYCHEIDLVTDGQLEHRFLFSDADWFAIQCHQLHVTRVERADREIPPISERLREATAGEPETSLG